MKENALSFILNETFFIQWKNMKKKKKHIVYEKTIQGVKRNDFN